MVMSLARVAREGTSKVPVRYRPNAASGGGGAMGVTLSAAKEA